MEQEKRRSVILKKLEEGIKIHKCDCFMNEWNHAFDKPMKGIMYCSECDGYRVTSEYLKVLERNSCKR